MVQCKAGGSAAVLGIVLAVSAFAHADDGTSVSPGNEPGAVRPLMLGPQIVNPADELRQPQSQPTSEPFEEGGLTHPWEMAPVSVYGQAPLREDDRIGSYAQPRWTADRRFAETRVYVRPEGSLQAEFWYIPTVNRKGPTDTQTQLELEFGLPNRIQLDLYLLPSWSGSGGATQVGEAIEFRYALADWGKIWLNPTFYIEYTKQDKGPDQLETKLLFGDAFGPRWHYGFDLTYQRDMGGAATNTYETTAGLSYTLQDSRIDLGAEAKVQFFDVHGHRGRFTDNIFIGPSLQFRPLQRMHVDLAPLVGVTHESPALQLYLVLGWEF